MSDIVCVERRFRYAKSEAEEAVMKVEEWCKDTLCSLQYGERRRHPGLILDRALTALDEARRCEDNLYYARQLRDAAQAFPPAPPPSLECYESLDEQDQPPAARAESSGYESERDNSEDHRAEREYYMMESLPLISPDDESDSVYGTERQDH